MERGLIVTHPHTHTHVCESRVTSFDGWERNRVLVAGFKGHAKTKANKMSSSENKINNPTEISVSDQLVSHMETVSDSES